MHRQHALCTYLRSALCAALVFATFAPTHAADSNLPDPARVEQLARRLPTAPRGVGPTIDDRAAWQAVAASPLFRNVVEEADTLLDRPIPELTDELFLDYSRTGNRTRCQKVLSARHGRVSQLVLAECIENRGRFLPAIEKAIDAVLDEKTWVLPAHDGGLRNFRGTVNEIDLAVAGQSWNLATVRYWLGDKLSATTRKRIADELERRTFTPFTNSVIKGQPRLWWLTGTNNWNAVCLAGVTGAALATIESPQRRAFFIAAAEKHVQNFLRGFTPDGYCSEGIGYWNYGFGHYVMLAETVKQATDGKMDMLAPEKIQRIARFGRRMEIAPDIFPAFADCSVGSQPYEPLLAFLSRRYGWGMRDVERDGLLLGVGPSTALFQLGIYGFANSATTVRAAAASPQQPLRDWFPDARVLICRPATDAPRAMAVALKGGHNAEHHNHNDVGTYLVVVGKAVPLVDPGAEVYTARTFSSRRYQSGVLNSFGHPVPRVAGKLQRTGRAAAARMLETRFDDAGDTVVMDLRAAYDVEGLKTLRRTFVYSRDGVGSLTVTDEAEFAKPSEFGTALITFGKWEQLAPNRLRIGEGGGAVHVDIAAEPGEVTIRSETIREDVRGGRTPTRLGIDLPAAVERARITLTIVPASRADAR